MAHNTTIQNREYTTFPGSLKTAEEISKGLKELISPERVLELEQAQYMPCRIVDGEYRFQLRDVKEWLVTNLMKQTLGRSFPQAIRVPIPTSPGKMPDLPQTLLLFAQHLGVYGEVFLPPCVYFLVCERKVVYVGKTTDLPGRISGHRREREKKFDCVFYLPVPEHELFDVESSFISILKPKYNHGKRGKLVFSSSSFDVDILDQFRLEEQNACEKGENNGDDGNS